MAIAPVRNYHKYLLLLLAALTAFRVMGLIISPLNLHGDEAQYWAWSRNFDWGYFSKPPMIAWLIDATTAIFGNEEWAVRLSSPLIHPITAYIVFRTGRFLFDDRTGFWAAILYFLMPAVWLSSAIVSTDVALLLFWALALNAWAHLRETPNLKWALLLGAAIGLGMLSKYAMLFFMLALSICIIIDPKTRRAMLSKYGLIISAIALIILSPNLLWNAANDFATVNHTAANANIKENFFHPIELLEFIISQFGVFGPLTMAALLLGCYLGMSGRLSKPIQILCVFTALPLLVICAEALLSRANANWAVSAYISGTIITAHFGLQFWEKWLKRGVTVNIFAGIVFSILVLSPALVNAMGGANAVKRVRGWPETQTLLANLANQGHDQQKYHAIATDNRLVFFNLLYYGIETDTGLPLRMWLNTSHPFHHAEAVAPLPASTLDQGPVLIINYYLDCWEQTSKEPQKCAEEIHARGKQTYAEKFKDDFVRLEQLPPLRLDLGGGKIRTYRLWAGYGYTPTTKTDR